MWLIKIKENVKPLHYWTFCELTYKDGLHKMVGILQMAFPNAISIQKSVTLRPRQNGWHFAGDIFKCIFLNESVWILLNISPKFVPKGKINSITALVQIMAWQQPGDKPLSEPIKFTDALCVTQPQWVKKEMSILVVGPQRITGIAVRCKPFRGPMMIDNPVCCPIIASLGLSGN